MTCCYCEFFKKADIALAEAAHENFSFSKNSLAQIDSKIKLETVWLPTHNAQ